MRTRLRLISGLCLAAVVTSVASLVSQWDGQADTVRLIGSGWAVIGGKPHDIHIWYDSQRVGGYRVDHLAVTFTQQDREDTSWMVVAADARQAVEAVARNLTVDSGWPPSVADRITAVVPNVTFPAPLLLNHRRDIVVSRFALGMLSFASTTALAMVVFVMLIKRERGAEDPGRGG